MRNQNYIENIFFKDTLETNANLHNKDSLGGLIGSSLLKGGRDKVPPEPMLKCKWVSCLHLTIEYVQTDFEDCKNAKLNSFFFSQLFKILKNSPKLFYVIGYKNEKTKV